MVKPTTRRLIIAAVGEVAVFALSLTAVLVLPDTLYVLEDTELGTLLVPTLGVIVGLVAAVRFRRWFLKAPHEGAQPSTASRSALRQLSQRSRLFRWAFGLVVVAYFVTWVVGVPAVLTDAAYHDARNNKSAADHFGTPLSPVFSASHFAIPVFPGVIIFYHEHWGGHLHGWGGWKLYLWYGFGNKELYQAVRYVT